MASSGTRVSNLRKIHTGVGSSLGDTSMKIGTPTFPRVCTELDPVAKVTKRCWICQELKNIAKFLILTPKGSTWPYSMCVLAPKSCDLKPFNAASGQQRNRGAVHNSSLTKKRKTTIRGGFVANQNLTDRPSRKQIPRCLSAEYVNF